MRIGGARALASTVGVVVAVMSALAAVLGGKAGASEGLRIALGLLALVIMLLLVALTLIERAPGSSRRRARAWLDDYFVPRASRVRRESEGRSDDQLLGGCVSSGMADVPSIAAGLPTPVQRAPFGDAPISNPKEDRLGRAEFAEQLAHQIQLTPLGPGFVVALVGPWGAGKSSVLRMLGEVLKDGNSVQAPQTVVVEFNPWLFSGTDQLLALFFETLADALPQQLGPRLVRRISSRPRFGSTRRRLGA
jgi:hypothetical protein